MFRIGSFQPDLVPVFKRIADADIKFATRVTVTRVSAHVQSALTAEIERVIDRPNALTRRAVRRRPRKDGKFFAYEVYLQDEVSKGTAPAKYLAPQIYGGSRPFKRFERALQLTDIAPGSQYAMPAVAARQDAHGNMSAGHIRQILSYFNAAQLRAGYEANSSDKTRRRLAKDSKRKGVRGVEYFISKGAVSRGGGPGQANRKRQHLPAGIWQRTSFGALGSAIKPVLIFTPRASRYTPHIKFYAVAEAAVKQHWPTEWPRALQEALRSSKSATSR